MSGAERASTASTSRAANAANVALTTSMSVAITGSVGTMTHRHTRTPQWHRPHPTSATSRSSPTSITGSPRWPTGSSRSRGRSTRATIGPAARLDGAGARAGHHDQGPGRARGVQGARRQALPAAPDRHARPRGLHLRGVALAGRVRRRAAARGRLAGGRGPDRREHLPRRRLGPRADPRDEQDRPPGRGARARGRGDLRADRRRPGERDPHLRQDRRGCDRAVGGDRCAGAPARGRARRIRRAR